MKIHIYLAMQILVFFLIANATSTFAKPIVVIIGPPGSGKGTQASMLKGSLNWVLISPSNILRDAKEKGSVLALEKKAAGEDDVAKDNLKFRIVHELFKEEKTNSSGVILDSWPKTANAIGLANKAIFTGNQVIMIELTVDLVDPNILISRALKRKVCESADCGRSFGEDNEAKDGCCRFCYSPLITKKRDNETEFPDRLKLYQNRKSAILNEYRTLNIPVYKVNCVGDKEEIHKKIMEIVNGSI